MPTWSDAIENWEPGDLVLATHMNAIGEDLNWLKNRPFATVTITSANTTSTSFAQMTGSSVSLTSTGGNMLIIFVGPVNGSGVGNTASLDLAIDGVRQGDATFGLQSFHAPGAGYNEMCSMVFMTSTPPDAGSRAYSVYWKTSAGTLSASGRLFVMEVR
jgi:hypothetical protein